MNRIISLFAAVLAVGGAPAFATEYQVDPAHTTVQFAVRHMMVNTVRGQFQKVAGVAKIDDKDLTKSSLDVTIDVDSIDTRDAKRDGHLKSPDFFDAAKNPKITFKSTKIEKSGDKYQVIGDLTMHGVTHPVTLTVDTFTSPVKNWGMLVRGVSATAKINRKDWGLAWNKVLESGGVLVGEEVQLQIDAELNAKAPATN